MNSERHIRSYRHSQADSMEIIAPMPEEDAYTSMSDVYDHEPRLEFDDSELTNSAPVNNPEGFALPDIQEEDDFVEPTASDGTIEDNFEVELAQAPPVFTEIMVEDFSDLILRQIVEVVGDDKFGRLVVMISACRLPKKRDLDHEKLLRYLIYSLDKFVEQDYSIVYLHHGLTNEKRPSMGWISRAYQTFERKYKKNLKALYLVHPTTVIKFIWTFMSPFISDKFRRKMITINYLHELNKYVSLNSLNIPAPVVAYNNMLLSKNPKATKLAEEVDSQNELVKPSTSMDMEPPNTQQFGVSLLFIKEKNPFMQDDNIPPVVKRCVEYLSQPDGLETEGLFRRSVSISVIKDLQRKCNKGEKYSFQGDPHSAASLLKMFLRDLEEPLLTFDLYEEISNFNSWTQPARQTKILILERLPIEHYHVLKYIFQFLWKVQDRSCLNKMTCNNLSIVFGPNIVWPCNKQVTLQSILALNAFTCYLLENQESIFII